MDNVLIEDSLDTTEVGILLDICDETVRRWCRDEKIKTTRASDKERSPWCIRGLDLADFILEHPKYYGKLYRKQHHSVKLASIRIEMLNYITKKWRERW